MVRDGTPQLKSKSFELRGGTGGLVDLDGSAAVFEGCPPSFQLPNPHLKTLALQLGCPISYPFFTTFYGIVL